MSQSLHFVNRHQFPAKAHLVENKDADTALKKKTKKAKRMRLIQQWCKKGWPALRSSPSIITHHPLWCCVSYLLTQLSFMLLIFIIIISIHKLWRKQEEWPIIKFWLLSLHLPTFQVRNRGPATSVSLKFKLLIYTILSRVGAFFDIIYKLEIVMFLGNQSFICSGHFAGTVAARGGFFAFQSSANFAFYTKLYFSLLYFLLPLETLPFTLLFPCSLPFFFYFILLRIFLHICCCFRTDHNTLYFFFFESLAKFGFRVGASPKLGSAMHWLSFTQLHRQHQYQWSAWFNIINWNLIELRTPFQPCCSVTARVTPCYEVNSCHAVNSCYDVNSW